jgi:hypothetical protein
MVDVTIFALSSLAALNAAATDGDETSANPIEFSFNETYWFQI